jgi:tetratricopeptide (TPR) repeat protein
VGDRAISYNSLGVAAEEGGAPAEALALFTRARQLHPENPDFPFNQGNALHALGRLDQAEAAYRASVAVDPGYLNGWYNLGVTLHQRGRFDEAKAAFRQVLRLDPGKADVRQILQQLGG